MARIELSQVKKTYGRSTAVSDLDLEIEDGELLVFLGPSGCGKTTTMNMIAGLVQPSSGSIRFDGEDVTNSPPHLRNTAMVFQSSLLYPHMTARRNILMSLRHSELSQAEKDSRMAEAASIVDIGRLLDKLPSEMSGGERQRVATAKAIVRHPSVFLLDEPLAALDAALRVTVRAELINLQKRLNTTMVLVTHDQIEAMTMGDRIAVMKSGRLEQIGSPDDIYNRPSSLFVAGFVGSPPMNFFSGHLTEMDGGLSFQSQKLRISLPEKYRRLQVDSDVPVVLGARPQALHISNNAAEEATFPATIYAIERLGSESIVVVEASDGSKLRAIAAPDFQGQIADIVRCTVDGFSALLFDKQTGQALRA